MVVRRTDFPWGSWSTTLQISNFPSSAFPPCRRSAESISLTIMRNTAGVVEVKNWARRCREPDHLRRSGNKPPGQSLGNARMSPTVTPSSSITASPVERSIVGSFLRSRTGVQLPAPRLRPQVGCKRPPYFYRPTLVAALSASQPPASAARDTSSVSHRRRRECRPRRGQGFRARS
jgi:hypothetical protein